MRFAEANTAFFPRVKKKKKTKRFVKNFQRIIILLLLLLLYRYCSCRSFHSYDDSTRLDSRATRRSMSYACVINLSKGRCPPPFRRTKIGIRFSSSRVNGNLKAIFSKPSVNVNLFNRRGMRGARDLPIELAYF